jgi:integrase
MGLYRRKKRDGTKAETYSADFLYRGIRVSENTGALSRKDARRWIECRKIEIDQRLDDPRNFNDSDLTIEQALSRYWEEKLHKSRSAFDTEVYMVKRLIRIMDAGKPLREMSTADVAKYISIRGESVSAKTIIREVRILSATYNWARDVWEHPVRPIAWQKIIPKPEIRVRRHPSMEEVRALAAAASPRLQRVILFAVLTGLRKAEIKSLKCRQIDLKKREMILIGKGNKEAALPLSSTALSLISSESQDPSRRVFDTANFRREWDKARTAAGLKHITFHGLRHAFATYLDDMGLPVTATKDAMRHSDIATTLLYVHADKKRLSDALETLGNTLDLSSIRSTGSSPESATGSAPELKSHSNRSAIST